MGLLGRGLEPGAPEEIRESNCGNEIYCMWSGVKALSTSLLISGILESIASIFPTLEPFNIWVELLETS